LRQKISKPKSNKRKAVLLYQKFAHNMLMKLTRDVSGRMNFSREMSNTREKTIFIGKRMKDSPFRTFGHNPVNEILSFFCPKSL